MCYVVVVFSAGIGRTGTFIVIDTLVNMIKEQGNMLVTKLFKWSANQIYIYIYILFIFNSWIVHAQ